MFIVLVMPLTVAAFWYGSTIQVSDLGRARDRARAGQSRDRAGSADRRVSRSSEARHICSFSRPPSASSTLNPSAAVDAWRSPRLTACS